MKPRTTPALRALRFALTLTLALAPEAALAGPTCEEMPCSVIRNCSSTGMQCAPDERDCTNAARDKNLEVKCEQQCSDGKRLVFCPPETGRGGDSGIVWMLLTLAALLAIGGGGLAWLLLRKKA